MLTSDPSPGDDRAVRVFISSTFRDMQRERDELVKRTFPRLRELCEQRGVTWTEVDLRWGISDERRAEGAVLPICLEEIKRCRPYFIGLLGERYGWVPDETPAELVGQEPWLGKHPGSSVTELEIREGVLNDPAMAEFAFFYFRDPSAIDALPPEERAMYAEDPAAADIARYGLDEARHQADERRSRLAALKEQIRQSGVPLHEGFADAEELSELVYQDLSSVIDDRFPADSGPTPHEGEHAAHEAFAASLRRSFTGRDAALAALDTQRAGAPSPLTVTGPPGIGKSAFLATWALRHRQLHPDELVVLHFVGLTPSSASPPAILHRLLWELGDRDEPDDLPWDVIALRDRLAARLVTLAAGGRRAVLVIVGLDRLDESDGGLELAWLPRSFPSEADVVLSSAPGRPVEELRRRAWPMLELPPLSEAERHDLAARYLAPYGKALTRTQAERIVTAPQTENPLFLRTLLEELRLFGAHELLDARIDTYLEARSPTELFGLVLERCQEDYDRERPNLTRDALSLLWAGRRGLAEGELLELLGSDDQPLPRAHWSPLLLALERSLTSHAGLLALGHTYLAEAVAARYLPAADRRRAVHRRLADYFATRPRGPRLVDELPWQLARAGEWARLADLLTDPDTFDVLWRADRFDVMARWAEVEAASDRRMIDAYGSWSSQDLPHETIGGAVELLRGAGHLAGALTLTHRLVELAEARGDDRAVARAVDAEATVQMRSGRPAEALALFRREEALCREAGDWFGVGRALNNEANVLAAQGEIGAAIDRYALAAEGWRAINDRAALTATLGNEAVLLVQQGELDHADSLFEEQATLSRELGDPIGLSLALDGSATVLMNRGDHPAALSRLAEEEAILRRFGHREGLATCLGNQGAARSALGDLEGALHLFREAEALSRELGDLQGQAESLGRQGAALLGAGRHDEAMVLLERQEAIARELGLATELQICLGNRAIVLRARGDLDGAQALLDEKMMWCRQLGDRRSLAVALGNQGNIALLRGDADGALELYREKEEIDRDLGNLEGLAHVLWSEAGVLLARAEHQRATVLIDEEVALRRQLGNPELLALALVHRVEALVSLGRAGDARGAANEAHALARENELVDLAARIGRVIQALG